MKTWKKLWFAAALAGLTCAAQAGRPLNVDDANVNEEGAGHIETWFAKQDGNTHFFTVAPAYAPVKGVELAVARARDTTNKLNLTTLQFKALITPSKERGCNNAFTVGRTHASANVSAEIEAENTNYGWLILTCNYELGSWHTNLGRTQTTGKSGANLFSMAWEHPMGEITPHIEWIAQEREKPTFGMGARTEIRKNIQLDGSLSRKAGENLYTLGMKFQF